MDLQTIIPVIWGMIIAFVILMYVILDGFDLGVGILFPWIDSETDRDVMINTIAPVWDGNATWLILAAALLYGAFPLAYSTILPVLYMPIMIMLAALIFRGIAFEFRFKGPKTSKYAWDLAFAAGSIVVAFTQGVMVGTIVKGFTLTNGIVDASFYSWMTPFSFATGIGIIVGYGLLGATWLIMRTTGELQAHMVDAAKLLLMGTFVFMGYVSLFTPLVDPNVTQRWFSFPNFIILAPIPIITLYVFRRTWVALQAKREVAPFVFSTILFILPFIGLGVSTYPYIIPHIKTVWEASAPLGSQLFMLVGTVILLPILLLYTGYAYYVFKGKVTPDTHHYYH